MFKYKLKGVGAATLDRGVAIIIGAVILAGIVTGVAWMYDRQKTDKFINDINILAVGARTYYNMGPYTDIDLIQINKAGYLPANFKLNQLGHVYYNKEPVEADYTGLINVELNGKYGFNLELANLDYKTCVLLGTQYIDNIVFVENFDASVSIMNKDLPSRNSDKLEEFEDFCEVNQNKVIKVGLQ